jgi:hypothetical protein
MKYTKSYFSAHAGHATASFIRTRLAFPWPAMPLFIPLRLRRRLRSSLRNRQSPASSITALQTSLSPSDTIRSLKAHRWSFYDGQYLFLAIIGVFSLCVIESPGPLVKTGIATLLLTSLIIPLTRQFFLPFLSIASWLILFYACRSVFFPYHCSRARVY